MWSIRRRIMRISWTEKKYGRIQMIPTQNHQKNTTTIFGHTNSADGLEKQILSEKICDTKSRGRQNTIYTDSENNLVSRKESANNQFIRITEVRED